MVRMEEDARKTDPATAGNTPQPTPSAEPAMTPPVVPAPIPKNTLPDSPFLGKLAPQKPAIPLNGPSLETDSELQKTIDALRTRTRVVPPQAQKPAEPAKEAVLSSEDLLHGGNVISLLQEEAQKEQGIEKAKETRLAKEDTPIERNIREIGLEPRRTDTRKIPADPGPKQPEGIRTIRTYASDMSEEIRKRGETLATIVNAEQTREAQEREKLRGPEVTREQKIKNLTLLWGAGGLVAVGVAAIITVVILTAQHPVETPYIGLIPSNHTEAFAVETGGALSKSLADLRSSAQLNLGEIEEIAVTQNGVRMSAGDLLSKLGAPDVLVRNATEIMVGVHAYNHNQPFILVRVSAYDRAFEGMLSWEPKMGEGLGAFFAPSDGTAPRLTFSDRVFQNLDTRESQPEWHIEYAFPEKNLLLITTNDSTIREVMTRLSLQSDN